MPTRPMSSGGSNRRQFSPAKKITDKPAAMTSSAVPRSGCFMIKPTGTTNSAPATAKSSGRNKPSRF